MADQNQGGGMQDQDRDQGVERRPNQQVPNTSNTDGDNMEEESGAGYGNNAGQQGGSGGTGGAS